MLRSLNHFVVENLATSSFFFTVAAVRLDRSCRSLQFAGRAPPAMIARRGNCQGCSNRGAGSSGCSKMSWTLRQHRNSHRTGRSCADLYRWTYREFQPQAGNVEGRRSRGDRARCCEPVLARDETTILDRVEAWRSGPATDDVSVVLIEIS